MFDGFIERWIAIFREYVSDLFGGVWVSVEPWIYISEWYIIGFAVIALMFVIGWFFAFLRPYAGFVVFSTLSFLTGLAIMFRHMRANIKKKRR